ncbi:MAG TPA: thioesterase family protein [Thermoanaerobaculia bacterium]|jgi:4-hydroxybenzoyl-CoA thioesterase/acyl-CoA thioester hydrolase|nr:thioesterase family protein [Thermoanaerobaculia bacterium]
MHELRTQRKVEFADTDMVGIVHFARFFVFMETAEHELLASLGTPVLFADGGRSIGWPRVSVACDYFAPARFGDVLDIHVQVMKKGRSSLTYQIDIARQGQPIARGRLTTVCCILDDPGGVRAIPIPPYLADQIDEAPAAG